MGYTGIFHAFLVFFFTLAVFTCQTADGVQIDVTPGVYNGVTSNPVNISCRIDQATGRVATGIVVMELLNSSGKPIVVLKHDSQITYGAGLDSRFHAEGQISRSIIDSYLGVTVRDPKKEDSGTFTCLLYYLDQGGVLRDERDSANLTVAYEDMGDIVAFLLNKVSSLDKQSLKQAQEITYLHDNISSMKNGDDLRNKTIAYQEAMIASLVDENKLHKSKLTFHENQILTIRNENKIQNQTIAHLESKINSLQDDNQRQNVTIANQETKMASMGNDIKYQNEIITDQGERITSLKTRIVDCNQTVSFLQRGMDTLKTSMENQTYSIEVLGKHVEVQQNLMDNYTQTAQLQKTKMVAIEDTLNQQQARDNFITAFSYGYNSKETFDVGDTLIFSEEILKLGAGYDPTSGVFTCQKDGIYVFHLLVLTSCRDCHLQIELRVNSKIVTSLVVFDNSYNAQASTSGVASIKAGDRVRPVVVYIRGDHTVFERDNYSVFSGVLVKLT